MKTDRFNRVIVVAFVLIWVGIFSGIFAFGWLNTWKLLLVPALSPSFADLRTVQSSLESIAMGYDPQIINPADPWNRSMNYPSIWIEIANFFNFQIESNYLIFIGGMILLYLIVCFLFLRKYPSVWLLLVLFSGASLLAVERGNNDLVIFSIVYFSAITPALIGGVLILFGSILKIYPIFSVLSLYKNKLILILVVFITALFFIYEMDELHKIRTGTPISESLSYGAASIAKLINLKYKITINPWWVSLMLITPSFVLLKNKQWAEDVFNMACEEITVKFFLIGAAIYLGTFIFSSNWDYRLIFLAFCIPYINHIQVPRVKVLILMFILLAGNQMLLAKVIGQVGELLCMVSKSLLFILLAWLAQLELIKTYRAYRKINL